MIAQIRPTLCEAVRGDLARHTARTCSWWRVIANCRRASFCAVFIYRLSAACLDSGFFGKAVARFLERINLMLHSCEIFPGAVIAPGFIMPHTAGIVIGYATIGANATIMHNVTIGRRNITATDGSDPKEYPVLGDGVSIAPGAVILGSIKIGNHAQIGANAVVLEDVPDGALAVGAPARNIQK